MISTNPKSKHSMIKRSISKFTLGLACLALLATGCGKKSDPSPSSNNNQNAKYGFQLAAGGQSVSQGSSVSLLPTLVDANGNVVTPTNVSYTVTPSDLGEVVNGKFVAKGTATGTGTVKATVTIEGVEYSTEIPVAVAAPASLFHVVPQAIIWQTGAGNIQLETVYFGTSAPGTITYSVTSGSNVVAVSNTGSVSFQANGKAEITVSTTIDGKAQSVKIPVLVVGLPAVVLPVARVAVTPNPVLLFRGESLDLAPKAYNSSNQEVTGETFTYTVIDKDTSESGGPTGPCVSVSSSGRVTPNHVGSATIVVTCKGISTSIDAEVLPDKVLLNSPFFQTLGTDPFGGGAGVNDFTCSVAAYTINKAAYKNKDYANMLTASTLPATLRWTKPTFPSIPELNQLFDIVDLSATTGNQIQVTKKPNGVGTTIVISYDANDLVWTQPGVTSVAVNP